MFNEMIHWMPAEHSPMNTCLAVFLSALLPGLSKTSRSHWRFWWSVTGWIFSCHTVSYCAACYLVHSAHCYCIQLCWSSLQFTTNITITFIARVKNTTNIMLHRACPAQHFQHCWDVSVLCLNKLFHTARQSLNGRRHNYLIAPGYWAATRFDNFM